MMLHATVQTTNYTLYVTGWTESILYCMDTKILNQHFQRNLRGQTLKNYKSMVKLG